MRDRRAHGMSALSSFSKGALLKSRGDYISPLSTISLIISWKMSTGVGSPLCCDGS